MANRITRGGRMFITILSIFLLYAFEFMFFQYRREKQYRISLLDTRLQEYNCGMAFAISPDDEASMEGYALMEKRNGLRVTVMTTDGKVIFDNVRKDYEALGNHIDREEVREALKNGSGYDIVRLSESTSERYFYSATLFPDKGIIVRSALPYDMTLSQALKADRHFIWLSLVVILILSLVMRVYVSLLDEGIRRDKEEAGSLTRRQLTQNLSHELKTPVASVKAYLETILETPDLDPATQKEFLQNSLAQTDRLTVLLEDMSTLNRLWDAPQSWPFDRTDLSQLMVRIVGDLSLQIEQKHVNVHDSLPFGMTVNGNGTLLYSIFRNLFDNSLAYAGEGCHIFVSGNADGDSWVIRYSDNGPGVPAEHLEHLFERFYRVDGGRSRKTGGSGLGLAIVKNAVQFHGGTVSAVNDGGLAFTITLPRA